MAEYIEREAALASIRHEDPAFAYTIERIPAADVRPVVRGEWLHPIMFPDDLTGHMYGECSNCGKLRIVDNFCPNCGADMRGEQDV